MECTRVFLIIFEVLCAFALINGVFKKSKWVLLSDFESSQLANLKPQEEHELLLKTLTKKNSDIISGAFLLELIAKSFDNEFFGLVANENANRENTAIVKASFDCFTKLLLQERVMKLWQAASVIGVDYVNETGNMGDAFARICSKIDEELKNETIYRSRRDEYQRNTSSGPKKIYQYGIAKSEEELRTTFAGFANDPPMKIFSAHLTWQGFFIGPAEVVLRKSILELAKVPAQLEQVQKIYDQSIVELAPLVEDVPVHRIDTSGAPIQMNLRQLVPILSDKLVEKINANGDLKSAFEPVYKRIHNDALNTTQVFALSS